MQITLILNMHVGRVKEIPGHFFAKKISFSVALGVADFIYRSNGHGGDVECIFCEYFACISCIHVCILKVFRSIHVHISLFTRTFLTF